jgi:Zn-dependent peptidase ImmA (M78 family)
LRLADVRELLSLDLSYYSSSDPTLIKEFAHRFRLFAKKTIPDIGRHLINALSKSRLCAFWIPDGAKIMIDSEVPEPKHRWIEAHEIAHSVTPWHRTFLLGDNLQTLDPVCKAMIEAEANYGAGRLLFFQDRFGQDARDLDLTFNSITRLAKLYSNSIVSTFWRTVEERQPTIPVFGLVSIHPLHADIGRHDGANPWRYFVRSTAFGEQFPSIEPKHVFALVQKHATSRRTGPIFCAEDILQDALGRDWEFKIESFSTKHALLTLGTVLRPRAVTISVPRMIA